MSERVSGFSMQIEAFGGASVEDLVKEMPAVAARVGIYVTCDINGIHILAGPKDDPKTLWSNYEKTRDRSGRFASANVASRGVTAS